jgi:transposase
MPSYHPRKQTIARISHQLSTATTQWRTLHDFGSVRALNIVLAMFAHSSVAKVAQGTPFRRLATKAGEKFGLARRHLSAIY